MPKLIQFDVKQTLFRMALPMLVGTITMNAYNLADTMYVAQLGTLPLAAMGFTFPVVMFFTLVASGVGTGITALSSNAMGRKDNDAAANIVTHGVCLIILFSILLAVCGYLSVNTIFNMLGADDQTLPFVRNYMNTWYFGAVFMAIPMMGNGILISLGDSKSASRFMALGAIVNIILDPIFIFGWLGVPALGILGAALATVISQAISSCWLFYLLAIKYPLIKFRQPNFSALLHSWKRISRMEMFAFVIPMALGMSLTPFVSQNYGGQRIDRIIEARKYATLFALGYGVFIALVFFIGAPYLAQLFTQDPDVTDVFITYVRTISFGYGMMEVHRYSGFFLTGMNRPVHTTLLTFTRVLVLLLPLSFLGSAYWGVSGIFAGRLITDLLSGAIGLLWVGLFLKAKIPAKS